ncbi:nucleoside-diphosphate-sugar epimerase [Mycetocola sp. BIGb0189]|uniref:SDR family oxidoreductase n=1 Tax=Mycetocola sp. BIGb0189 TaxID=2940604 RepID=UPI00216915D2|nr:NAD(P)H-binding protein [Mycetocola sp. BIGb0189]MCS4276462.1 nucleoside-diphosphate-sugar epimerase [Mycetocola sp. BIGb0189]
MNTTISADAPASRIFLAGATGVIGTRLIPLLVEAGFTVGALTRSAEKAAHVTALGAEPLRGDVYDRADLSDTVLRFGPDIVLNQLTDLPDTVGEIAARPGLNARIRTEGNRNLLAAAQRAGATRFLAQSVAWPLTPGTDADAIAELEESVLAVNGVVLRYGQFYGPGTFYPDTLPTGPRIQIDEAARRTVAALGAPSGVLTILD